MIAAPMDVLQQFPVRRSKKQKQAFRDAVQAYARKLGYQTRIEKGPMGCRNIVLGDPDRADYLVTAHYDTCAGMLLPNTVFPQNLAAFLICQLAVVAVMLGIGVLAALAAIPLTGHDSMAFLVGLTVYWIQLICMIAGPANCRNANDNTSGVVAVLETAASMPESYRDRVCFVLFDQEELGLVGSAAHRKIHKTASSTQIVLNLDCVGDGDEIWLFPNKNVRKNEALMDRLCEITGYWGSKSLHVHQKGFALYPSDQASFPGGVGIGAFRRKKLIGIYYGRIHTFRDTILDYTNINILRAALVTLIARHPGDHQEEN